YGAGGVLLAVSEKLSGRAYLTEYEPAADTFHKLRMTGLLGPGKATYLFPLDAHAWYLSQSKAKSLRVFATDERGKRLRDIEIRLPESFMRDHAPESLLAIAVSFGEELSGRLYILNPRLHASLETEVAVMLRLARQVTPPIYNVYLRRRLKATISVTERSRIARDLHDGVVQSLTGLSLNIEGQRDQQR